MKTILRSLTVVLALGSLAGPATWTIRAQTATAPAIEAIEELGQPTETKPVSSSREIVVVGKNVTLKAGETCKQIVVISGAAHVDGNVDGDVVVVAGSAEINGRINGGLVVVLGSATLGANAVVHRDAVVIGGPLEESPGARIEGQKQEINLGIPFRHFHLLGGWFGKGLLHGRLLPLAHGWWWRASALMVLLYVVILLLFPRPVQACVRALDTRPVASFFSGILAFLVVGPLILLLIVSGIGLLLIPFLLCALLAAAVLSKVTVYTCTGQHIGTQLSLTALRTPLLALLAGVILFYLIYLVPFIGFIAWGLVATLGLGAVLLAFFAALRKESGKTNGSGPSAPLTAAPTPAGAPPVFAQPVGPQAPAVAAQPGSVVSNPMTMNLAGAADGSTPGPTAAPPAPVSPATPANPAPPPVLNAAIPGDAPPPISAQSRPATAQPIAASGLATDAALLPQAGFWLRLWAVLLDVILVGVIIAILHLDRFFVPLWVVYHVAMWTWRGTTIGGVILGLKIVRPDGRPLDFGVALVRSLASFFSFAVLGLGFFWAGWDKEKQSWHDKIAGTVIVKTPKGMALI